MSPFFYTEIRIKHKSKEDKADYEAKLDLNLMIKGYANRVEFIREKIRELVNEELSKEQILQLDKAFDDGVKEGKRKWGVKNEN